MSLFGSLTTAVGGLDAQQQAIGNISNNIANSQTIGYKEVGTSFQELVTDSNQNYNAPGGVIAKPTYNNNLAGSLVTSQTSTNLAISGSGFFDVKSPADVASSTTTSTTPDYYTQAGDFSLSTPTTASSTSTSGSAGSLSNQFYLLTNSAGYHLAGWPIINGVADTTSAQLITIPQSVTTPNATANVDIAANLPSNFTTFGTTGYTSPSPVQETIYDAQGNPLTLNLQFDHLATNQTVGTSTGLDKWQVTATVTNYTGASGSTTVGSSATPVVFDVYFNTGTGTAAAGTINSIASSATDAVTGTASAATAGVPTTTTGSATVTLPFVNDNDVAQTVALNFGTLNTTASSTSTNGDLTEYSGSAVNVVSATQDGYTSGSFTGVSVDAEGFVSANYTNGTAKKLWQIPVAQFNASQDLDRLSGSVYQATADSGAASLAAPGTNGGGTISPSTLEESNVDIATEFTNLIVAQQAYSANAKVITTANSLLQTLLNVIQ